MITALAQWIRLVGTWVTLCCLSSPAPGAADCLAPPFEVLWSYPADGETNLPIDGTFWVFATRGESTQAVSATLNGEALNEVGSMSRIREGQAAFRLTPDLVSEEARYLQPDTEYELRVRYMLEGGEEHVIKAHFTTGSQQAPPASARLRGLQTRQSMMSDDHPCKKVIDVGACACNDSHSIGLHRFVVDAHETIAWYVKRVGSEQMRFWPSACGDPAILMNTGAGSTCYFVYGIDARGDIASLNRLCGEGTAMQPFERKGASITYRGSLSSEVVAAQAKSAAAQPAPAPAAAKDRSSAVRSPAASARSGCAAACSVRGALASLARRRMTGKSVLHPGASARTADAIGAVAERAVRPEAQS